MGKSSKIVKQGDIFMVNLSTDSKYNEQGKCRPCVVVSCDIRNDNSSNIFIFPLTHSTNKKYQPCHYKIYKKDYQFLSYEENIVLCEEGRSISKNRLERKLGSISKEDLCNILSVKEYVFVEK